MRRREKSIHWSETDDDEIERWHKERVERAGGSLFFHAEWKRTHDTWAAKVREVCRGAR